MPIVGIGAWPAGQSFDRILSLLPAFTLAAAFGGSGCSEAYQSSGNAAIVKAIYNAAGIRAAAQPAAPDKIKKAIEERRNGKYKPQEKYDFGSDFHEALDYMKEHPQPKYIRTWGRPVAH